MGKKNVVWNSYISKSERFADLINGVVFRTDLREVFGFLQRQGDKAELVRYVEENGAFRHLKEDAFDVLGCYPRFSAYS